MFWPKKTTCDNIHRYVFKGLGGVTKNTAHVQLKHDVYRSANCAGGSEYNLADALVTSPPKTIIYDDRHRSNRP